MVLSVAFLVVMSKKKATAGIPSLRKYFQPLQVSYVTLSIQVELARPCACLHDFSYRPHNRTGGLQRVAKVEPPNWNFWVHLLFYCT